MHDSVIWCTLKRESRSGRAKLDRGILPELSDDALAEADPADRKVRSVLRRLGDNERDGFQAAVAWYVL